MKEVAQYHKKSRDEYKEALVALHNKQEISNKVIKSLQAENDELKNIIEKNSLDKSSQVQKLLEKIDDIQRINNEKKNIMENLEKEQEKAKAKFKELQQQNKDLNLKLETVQNVQDEPTNLSEELGILDPRAHNVSPAGEPDDTFFQKTTHVKSHDANFNGETLVKKIWKLNKFQLKKSINSQKLKLASDILQLKEKEFSENKRCACKRFCGIHH